MAVSVTLSANGQTATVGKPSKLFVIQSGGYAVSNDGLRVLNYALIEQATTAPITVVLNWMEKR
jgi:hypothetical protein